jgi:hypothetical protein
MVSRVVGGVATNSYYFGGAGQIQGSVAVKSDPTNTPVARRVRLHGQIDGRLVAETWSNPLDGAYAFERLRMDFKFYVVAFDHTGVYGGVVETDITPEPMP